MADTNIEQSICEAIEIIVDKAIAQATYDKTIQATITSCEDQSAGYYKLRYQDSIIYAYSLSTDVTYSAGTSVYVLVPASDMSNIKTILGTVAALGTNYIEITDPSSQYQINGKNVITANGEYGLQSYREGGCWIYLYSKNNAASDNAITVDNVAVEQYLLESENIICGADFRTELPPEQQSQGDYGIVFALDFRSPVDGQTITQNFIINIDSMTGQPYNFVKASYQQGVFPLDTETFLEVNSIYIYCINFPHTLPENQLVDDIFVSNPELCGATRLSEDELTGYSLTFTTPQGTYFTKEMLNSETLTIEAVLKDAGKIVNISAQELSVFWFSEDASITSASQYYCVYGGSGWKCLNDYIALQDATDEHEAVVEWIPASEILTIAKSDVLAKEVQYKCAIIYNSTVVSKTITIKNLGAEWEITIESDSGTDFYYSVGCPTITCLVDGESQRDGIFTYTWAKTDSLGNYEVLQTTTELNEEFWDTYTEEIDILEKMEKEYPELYEDQLKQLEELLAELKKQTRIDQNIIANINVAEIYNFVTYKCSVYREGSFIGTASITLNNWSEATGYTLIMHNNSFTYKYDESGIGPTSTSCLSPITLLPLSFTLYDCDGVDITEEVQAACGIKWAVPLDDTLLSIPTAYIPDYYEDGYAIYTNLLELNYTIATRYDITKQNNDIYLVVEYEGMILSAKSNLTFVKEGESGTNGTEYSCKIVPKVSNSAIAPQYLLISESPSGSYSYNYSFTNNIPFNIELYHSENLVLSSNISDISLEGTSVTITWSILKNKYTSKVSDDSSLSINSNTGAISYTGFDGGNPAHIVKAEVKVGSSATATTLYATYPVLTIKYEKSGYDIKLKEYTGFLYATYTSDGLSPKYDNTNPFTLTVKQSINNIYCDVSDDNSLKYEWDERGRVYYDDKWVDKKSNLNQWTYQQDIEDTYYQWYKPTSEYDGWCVTNAIVCSIGKDGELIATIHIPVHLMINCYGLASLNGWDGNSIEINEEGGFILAPQVGAGHKENDNSFTGIVIGDIRESNSSTTETGLFGYNYGNRSIHLDAETGQAIFGVEGCGQIVINPSANPSSDKESDHSRIYSGTYYNNDGTGLLIDFDEPCIKFGSGNFSVDKDGYLIAKGGGTIAGWNIDDTSLWSDSNSNQRKSNTTSIILSSSNIDERTSVNGQTDTALRILVNNTFGVNSSGKMYASSGIIGSGTNKITLDKSTNDSDESAIYSGSKTYFNAGYSGFYLGTDGIALGKYSNNVSAFQVTADGELTARSGYIGNGSSGWEIGSNYIRNGSKSSYDDTGTSGVYIGTGGIGLGSGFYVSNNGKIYSISGEIGGWTIDSKTLSYNSSSGSITIGTDNYGGYIRSSNWYIYGNGKASFSDVYISGTIESSTISGTSITGGTISGTSISGTSITGGTISGTSISATSISGGTISGATISAGSLSIGGTSITTSGLDMTANSTTVGNTNLSTYIQNLVVDTLNVSDSFTFQGYSCKWQSVKVYTGNKISWTTITGQYLTDVSLEDGVLHKTVGQEHRFTTEMSMTFLYKDLFILTYASDEQSEGA